ncbi:MAG: PrsW family glutamic-type intramembrane protease [Spirochaetota bacterium]
MSLLLFISILPGVLLLLYILYMDRNEREPFRLVLMTMFLGALSTIPAGFLESWISTLHPIFEERQGMTLFQAAMISFVQVAPVEEFCKLSVVLLYVWRKANFNEENDGIVYVASSALGFAIFENVLYVFQHGFGTGVLRAFTAVPLHTFTAVIMGFFVGLARFSQGGVALKIFIGFFLASFIHGLYDTFAFAGKDLALLIFPTVFFLVIAGIVFLKKGRNLSLQRWQKGGRPTKVNVAPRNPSKFQVWKLFVSRGMIFLSLLFWLFLYLVASEEPEITTAICIATGFIFTGIPLLLAIALEVSYFRNKRLIRKT